MKGEVGISDISHMRRVRHVYGLAFILVLLVYGVNLLLVSVERVHLHIKSDVATAASAAAAASYDPLRLNITHIRDGLFRPTFKDVIWSQVDDQLYVTRDNDNNYVVNSVVDGKYKEQVYNATSFVYDGIEYTVDEVVLSPDFSKVILQTNTNKNWRHSSTALYWFVDLQNPKEVTPIKNGAQISVTKFSSNSLRIAYVYKNNLYTFDTQTKKLTQVTFDGEENAIINGKPDWGYEEEILATDNAIWWSPKGDRLAYLRFNITQVPEFDLSYYIEDHGIKVDTYPSVKKFKYAKAGNANPEVQVHIYDVVTNKDHPIFEADDLHLVTNLAWIGDYDLLYKTTNRVSTKLDVSVVSTNDNAVSIFSASVVRSEQLKDSWYEPFTPFSLDDGSGYVDGVYDSQGFLHLAYFKTKASSPTKWLTSGNFEVTKIYGIQDGSVYFQSTRGSGMSRQLLTANIVLGELKELTPAGEGFYDGKFSSNFKYLILYNEGPSIPKQEIILVDNLMSIKVLTECQDIRKNLHKYKVPQTNFGVLEIDDLAGPLTSKVNIHYSETLPPGFTTKKKYPVIFYAYGGPGSQIVTRQFSVGFSQVLLSYLNAIVVTVDGRGTGFNNENGSQQDFKFKVKNNLGHYESLDQISAAQYYLSLPYVSSDHIAIWGWSYGGYLTLKTLSNPKNLGVFSYGVSIAPVTSWRYYDSMYTERYMNTPTSNEEGYVKSSVHEIDNFKNNVVKFMIGHGTGDDNVHFQNSMKLIDQFDLHEVENYEFNVFPDSDHSISFHNGNKVVYDRILDFFHRNIRG
ncbi:uncharacterized protein KQ657_002927 [Scheffersomyces spartinae]|uniref:Uncharacterized protein n=1 Tax=Scheffersomyces spartinae TaxID=45513 RepID=A0A9P7V5C1_9ASCO|nr:uncharacterized protein KQ657_002927 [Scheffersomyces spartinae]KAG7191658.1 hypothetical protein KQ657_002927 [Scheffersomyces spartinae]